MTGNAHFTTPLPALATLGTAITDLRTAMALTNYKRSRGAKAELADTVQKAVTLKNLLLALLSYVQQTAQIADPQAGPAYTNVITSSGFGLRSVRSITPALQIARFVRQTNNKQFPGSLHRLNWRRPLGLIKGQPVAGYNLILNGAIFATTTKTNFIFSPTGTYPLNVIIQPFNSRGVGNSFLCTVK
jgi:hypothetical protein